MNSSLATLASNLEKKDPVSVYDFVKNYFLQKRYPTRQCYPEPPSSEPETQIKVERLKQERSRANYHYERINGWYLYATKMDDYRNRKPIEDPESVDPVMQDRITTGLELLMRKGVYPYEWTGTHSYA